MEKRIAEIAERIRSLRELEDISKEEMAKTVDVPLSEYEEYESGKKDVSFTFLYKCAKKLDVDIIELLTGEAPHLTEYTVVRKGQGLRMDRREGFEYLHLAAHFKTKSIEPFLVKAPYIEEDQNRPIVLQKHNGQEFDYVIEGKLKFQHGNRVEILNAGDSVYYDSGKGHGMIAADKKGCTFLAVIMKEESVKR